ncbi:hypothetical protein JTB14_024065 [Gonioctena quinquepunctata]|nr:hypothetical protein JTB14_024065 [Gonioctena quinquepunctata]
MDILEKLYPLHYQIMRLGYKELREQIQLELLKKQKSPKRDANNAYDYLMGIIEELMNIIVPLKVFKTDNAVKNRNWITLGIKTSSKRKQHLYRLKNNGTISNDTYQTHCRIFEKVVRWRDHLFTLCIQYFGDEYGVYYGMFIDCVQLCGYCDYLNISEIDPEEIPLTPTIVEVASSLRS